MIEARSQSEGAGGDFRARFCARRGCRQEAFVPQLLWECIEPAARPLALIIGHVRRGFFDPDREYLQHLAAATSRREIDAEAGAIQYESRLRQGLLRRFFRVRISGRRLARLGRELLS